MAGEYGQVLGRLRRFDEFLAVRAIVFLIDIPANHAFDHSRLPITGTFAGLRLGEIDSANKDTSSHEDLLDRSGRDCTMVATAVVAAEVRKLQFFILGLEPFEQVL